MATSTRNPIYLYRTWEPACRVLDNGVHVCAQRQVHWWCCAACQRSFRIPERVPDLLRHLEDVHPELLVAPDAPPSG